MGMDLGMGLGLGINKHTEIEYLRVIVSEGMVEMDLVKVSGVLEWLEPQNKREVQSFIGFVNFYQQFIKDFSHHAHCEVCLRYFYQSLHATVFMQMVFSTVIQGYS